MMSSKRFLATVAWLFLLIALCIPALSGALAEDDNLIDIPIGQTIEVYNEKGESIGTLEPDPQGGAMFQPTKGDPITGVRVRYLLAALKSANQGEMASSTTKVQLTLMQAATPSPETTQTDAATTLPQYVWIDSNLVITALSARVSVDKSRAKTYEDEITALKASLAKVLPDNSEEILAPTATPINVEADQERAGAWVVYAALALGIVCAGALGWIALSVYASKNEKERQTEQLKRLNERFDNGVSLNTPVKVEQVSWPKDARVEVISDSFDRMAANLEQSGALFSQMTQKEPVKEPEPLPIPEGEEPDLLALANSLAGIASATDWRKKIQEAGFRYELLTSNPSDKGNYIADESGFSIIAALMRGPEAELAYIVPSYHDSKASEDRWSEFYSIEKDISVLNYRVDKLPAMFIDRSVFYLLKSPGKLTRRS